METSWTMRTTATPPPYVRIDNRRRPTQIAHLDVESLPVISPSRDPADVPLPMSSTQEETLLMTPESSHDRAPTLRSSAGPSRPRSRHPTTLPASTPEIDRLARASLLLQSAGDHGAEAAVKEEPTESQARSGRVKGKRKL